MQKFISKYGLAAHLALTAVAPLFLSPVAVLYLTALAAVWVVIEPSRIGSETLHDAHKRVIGEVVRDPVFWISIGVAVMALVRYLNGGVARAYDAELGRWSLAVPSYPLLPGSTDAAGYDEFVGTVVLIPVLQGCRHALGRSARTMFIIISSAIAGCVAGAWIAGCHLGLPSFVRLTDTGTLSPSYVGSVFGIYFVASMIGLFGIFERGWIRSLLPAFIGAAGTGAGLFFFAPPYVVVLFVGAALVVFFYSFVHARLTMSGVTEFRYMVLVAMAIAVSTVAVIGVMDGKLLDERITPYFTGKFLSDELLSLRSLLDSIALRMWKTHPWIGSGLGSYMPALGFHVTPEEWNTVIPLQSAPLNGYWMLLIERGTVGAFVIASVLALLLWTYFRRLVKGIMQKLPHPACWIGPLVLIVVSVQSLVDVTFLMPGMLIALAAMLAISSSSFPKEKTNG